MAIIYKAQIVPTKPDLVRAWLDDQAWGGAGDLEVLGSYRFDDPDGEIGIEALIVARGGDVLHVPMIYRAAPLDGAASHLMGTMEHSVLGERWVYDATGDPVALGCFARALRSEQEQASLEIWEGDTQVGTREVDVHLVVGPGGRSGPEPSESEGGTTVESGDHTLRFARVVGQVDGVTSLTAEWAGGRGVVAALV